MSTEDMRELIEAEIPTLSPEGVDELAEAVRSLIEGLRPEEIWVFGSQARGTAGEESDVDLMVIVSESDLPPHRRDQEALEAIGTHTLPLDVLVLTRAEFEQRKQAPSSLPAVVLREGRRLYLHVAG